MPWEVNFWMTKEKHNEFSFVGLNKRIFKGLIIIYYIPWSIYMSKYIRILWSQATEVNLGIFK